jgi:hypothetical protein
VSPDPSREKGVVFPPKLDFKEDIAPISRICAGLHNSQEMQHKLEEYSRKSKKITNQKTHKTQRAHDKKSLKDCTSSN